MLKNTLELSQKKLFSLTPDLRSTGFYKTQILGHLPVPHLQGI